MSPPGVGGESRTRAWGFTGVLSLLMVLNFSDKLVLGLAAQPLAEELGLSASQIGFVGSAFFVTFTVGGLLAGLFNKWVSLRWSLALLALAWAATTLPVVIVATFAVLLASRMALGFFEGPSSALIHAATYSWHPQEKRGLPSAFITAGSSIAKIAVAPALTVVIISWGWRAAIVVLAVAAVVWCLFWMLTWREGPYGEQSARKTAGTSPAGDEQCPQAPRVPWARIFLSPSFLGGAAAVFAMYAIVSSVLTWLPSYFELGLGYTRLQAGAMFSLPSIAAIVMLFVVTSTSDWMIARGATSRALRGVLPAVGLLICGCALALLPYIDAPVIAVVVLSVGYGFGGTIFPLMNAAISQIVPASQVAGTLGVFLAATGVGGVVGPYLTGVVVDNAASAGEGYATAFQVFGVIAIVGAVLALLAVNPERDAKRLQGR